MMTDEEIEQDAHEIDLKHDALKDGKVEAEYNEIDTGVFGAVDIRPKTDAQMEKTMTLSDKVAVDDDGVGFYYEPDLKASMKRIKEGIEIHYFDDKTSYYKQVCEIIDKELGAELT